MRRTTSLPPSSVSLRPWVFAGCRKSLLGSAPSRRYLRKSFLGCLAPYPGCPHDACARFFPRGIGLPQYLSGSARGALSRKRLHAGVCFRGCRHFVMFRPPSLLATRVVPTVGEFFSPGPLWLLRPRISRFVTSPSSGYTHRPNRAIDGRGTYTLQDLRPCRPLLGIPNALLCPAQPFDKPATSAGVPRTARQGEVAGRKAPGRRGTSVCQRDAST